LVALEKATTRILVASVWKLGQDRKGKILPY
jgi:hypothetical protein